MDEQFDKKLTDRIREVFDNYEYPPADEGWIELRKKFPAEEKHNKVAWLWWSSAAAVLLVFLGLGLWIINKPDVPVKTYAQKPAAKHPQQKADTATTVTAPNVGPLNDPQQSIAKNNTPAFYNTYQDRYAKIGNTAQSSDKNPLLTRVDATVTPNDPAGKTAYTVPVTAVDSGKVVTVNKAPETQIAQTQQPETKSTVNGMAKQQPAKTMASMFNEDRPNQVDRSTDQDKQSKKVNFSVYAATYFNYAEGSANQVNAGAGFTSDIKLSKNFKLSTGVALAQNTLSYNSSPPNASKLVASAPSLRQESLFSANAVEEPVFKNYNASLVGLDIPVNIKYEFNPEKSDTYISAGLSSGTFINENYSYRYAYANGTALVVPNQETDNSDHKSFNSFYFGKTLNFSFGVGYPIGKSNRLIVEPFVKYPLSGLGSQEIRFGAGGVNLKFNFKSQKK